MKVFLSLLLGVAFATDAGVTTGDGSLINAITKCYDGMNPGKRTDANCDCQCTSAKADDLNCVTLKEIKAILSTSATPSPTPRGDGSSTTISTGSRFTDEQLEKLQRVRDACVADNPLVSRYKCQLHELRVRDSATTCAGSPLYCDQTDRCTAAAAIAAQKPIYFCTPRTSTDISRCKKWQIACGAADAKGNIIASESFIGDALRDDGTLCGEICNDSGKNETDSSGDECDEGRVDPATGCFTPCVKSSDGTRLVYSDTPEPVTNLVSKSDDLAVLTEFCKGRNTNLATCPIGSILPRPNALGCGCPICVEPDCDKARRFIMYKDGDVKKCVRIDCELTKVITYAQQSSDDYRLIGLTQKVTFPNVRRTETKTTVALKYCTDGEDTTTTTTATPTDICATDVCARYENIDVDPTVCVYDNTGKVLREFACPEKFKCAVKDAVAAGTIDRYSFRYVGRCKQSTDTTDECTVGDVWVHKKKRDRKGRGCPKICKCIENPANTDTTTYRNIIVCDSIKRQFKNLRAKCASKLSSSLCTVDRLTYTRCPLATDDDPCSVFTCNTDADLTDEEVDSGVCKRSSERFDGDAIAVRDATTGCKRKVCVEETGTRVAKRYDAEVTNDLDAQAVAYKIREQCKLACRGVTTLDTAGVCNVCPSCGQDDTRPNADICAANVLNRKDTACREIPKKDLTRDDADNDAVDAYGNVTVGFKFCAEDFYDYERDEIYEKINGAMLAIVRAQCANVVDSFEKLRCAVVDFDYSVTAVKITDCDLGLLVKVTVTLTDPVRSRIKDVVRCLKSITDLRVNFATQIKERTKNDRIDPDTGNVRTTGARIEAVEDSDDASDPSPAVVSLTETDGTTYIPLDDTTTTANPQEPTAGDANTYTMIFAFIATFMAFIF